MAIVAPIACRPLTCWSTGRWPMAQPPGSETLARPQRASSGPSTSTEARIVLTRSYPAVGSVILSACKDILLSAERSPCTPICPSSFAMVEMSMRRGMFLSDKGRSESSAAHIMGSAAFFAPEMATSPSSARPPVIRSLSTRIPLLGRNRAHRQRVDLLAHALAQRRIHQLVALHAVAAGTLSRYDERPQMLHAAAGLD